MQVPIISIICMAVSGIFSIGLPIFLMIFFRKKYRAPLLPVLFGAAAFIVAVLIAERLIHTLVFANTALLEHPYLYVLYGIFMAGIFEETARFLVFRFIKRRSNKAVLSPAPLSFAQTQTPAQTAQKPRDVGTALNYGVGHGGAEAIILVGVAMISNIVISIMINAGMWDMLTGKLDATAADALITQLSALWETAPAMFLVGGIERIFAVGIQISLSVIVFYAVFGERKRWLYPAAILLHAIIDLPAAMMQAGFIRNIAAVEVSVGLSCIVLIVIAGFAHRSLRTAPVQANSKGEMIAGGVDLNGVPDVSVVLEEEPPIEIDENESAHADGVDLSGVPDVSVVLAEEPPIVIDESVHADGMNKASDLKDGKYGK